jgi:hypothetical protein
MFRQQSLPVRTVGQTTLFRRCKGLAQSAIPPRTVEL